MSRRFSRGSSQQKKKEEKEKEKENQKENPVEESSIETIEQEKEHKERTLDVEAEKSALKNITRRKIIYIVIVLVVAIGVVFGILAGIMASQIQTVVTTGPSPPINESILNQNLDVDSTDPVVQQNIPKIPQGGSLISRPYFLYQFTFITDLVLTKTGTESGQQLWSAKVPGLVPSSRALTRLTNRGLLQVVNSSGQIIWTNEKDYSDVPPPGSYTLQVVEFASGGGQIQITNAVGNVVWFRNGNTPS